MPEAVVDGLEVVLVDEDNDGLVAMAAQEALGVGGAGVAAQEAGERIASVGGDTPVQGDGVDGPAGQRKRRGGDEERAGGLP
ncbi:hypothetical protein [Streptomyces chilikensis]|uniref:Uncharacterized protein n=1 Tax=Streptomyces chilikensis TaxID=1194079 RepID=A0ABV3EXR9_9ACTN